MAALDDRIEQALGRLREELHRLRLANDSLDRRLATALNPAFIVRGIHVPRPIILARNVLAWFTRWRHPSKRKFRYQRAGGPNVLKL